MQKRFEESQYCEYAYKKNLPLFHSYGEPEIFATSMSTVTVSCFVASFVDILTKEKASHHVDTLPTQTQWSLTLQNVLLILKAVNLGFWCQSWESKNKAVLLSII